MPLPPGTLTGDVAADAAGNTIKAPGHVTERGQPSFITRLDMTDRGPLGTCQQNCLAYGFGRDETFGAHRGAGQGTVATSANPTACSAQVPKEDGSSTFVHCNLDYDLDGNLDRKSYAIASSYREECADPSDGVAWAPAFNISSGNTNITAAGGCSNDLPNFTGGSASPITAFCDQGDLTALNSSIAQLEAKATVLDASGAGALSDKGTLTDKGNWWGGAHCHMGNTITSYVGKPDPGLHPHTGGLTGIPDTDVDALGRPDYWVDDECDSQEIVLVDKGNTGQSTITVGDICGCGVLILHNTALKFQAGSHFLWRGLVVWQVDTASATDLLDMSGGYETFLVDGGTLMTGTQDFKMQITFKDGNSTVVQNNGTTAMKMFFRYNPKAISDAFGSIGSALKGYRRLQ